MLKPFLLPLLILAPLIFFCVGVGEGTWQNPLNVEEIMLQIRLPRIIVALLVGAALSASGSACCFFIAGSVAANMVCSFWALC